MSRRRALRSGIYVGEVLHARHEPVSHAFRYPHWMLALDLSELPALRGEARIPGLGVDRPGLVSFHQADYLGGGEGPLRGRLERRLNALGHRLPAGRVALVTTPRVLGHTFNPVSFYFCHGPDDALALLVAEVNNTFGDGHLYVVEAPDAPGPIEAAQPRAFHVSPFNEATRDDYRFTLAPLGEHLDVSIDITRAGGAWFNSRVRGQRRPLDARHLASVLARHPLTMALQLPRILYQAGLLYLGKGLPHHPRPEPTRAATFASARAPYLKDFRLPGPVARALGAS